MSDIKEVPTMSDDLLLGDLMDWVRISRNEGGLRGEDRLYFKALIKEINKRKLFKPKELYHEK